MSNDTILYDVSFVLAQAFQKDGPKLTRAQLYEITLEAYNMLRRARGLAILKDEDVRTK